MRREMSEDRTRSQLDATHPLFNGYRSVDRGGGLDRYYCKECQSELFSGDLSSHFTSRAHRPVESCLYCEGPVCEYYLRTRRFYYHNCEEPPGACGAGGSVRGGAFKSLLTRLTTSLPGQDTCRLS